MKRRRELLAAGCAALLVALVVWLAGWVFRPMRMDFGANWGGYLQEERDSIDVLFLGSSLVYCDVVPAVIWEEAEVASYVLGGPEQTIPMTYFYLSEALKTQKPQVVFLEMTGMYYQTYMDFTKANVDYMPASWNRLRATFTAAEPELRFGLLVPAFNYHDRWSTIEREELAENLRGYQSDALAGYTFLTDAKAMAAPKDRALPEQGYAENAAYFQKIVKLCRAEGITLIPYIAPGFSRIPQDKLTRIEAEVAALGLDLLDCNAHFSEFGFDPERDFYDTLHTNCYGAEKFSRWLGRYLADGGWIEESCGDAALWEKRVAAFHARVAETEP